MNFLNFIGISLVCITTALAQPSLAANLPNCWSHPQYVPGEFLISPSRDQKQSLKEILLLISYSSQLNLEPVKFLPKLRTEQLRVVVKAKELQTALEDELYRSEVEKQIIGILQTLKLQVECVGIIRAR